MISVVMVAFNASMFVREAVESVLAQTYRDFEFIVADDGSTDDTFDILSSYSDKRIRLYKRQHDYIASLNYAMGQARGTYIARMDADDVMFPTRLAVQHELMERHAEIDVCASRAVFFWQDKSKGFLSSQPQFFGRSVPLCSLLRRNSVIHPSTFMRRSFFVKHKVCYKDYPFAEDYKMWFDVLRVGGVIFVYPKPLLFYRLSYDSESLREKRTIQRNTSRKIQLEMISFMVEKLREPKIADYYHQVVEKARQSPDERQFVVQAMCDLFEILYGKRGGDLPLE